MVVRRRSRGWLEEERATVGEARSYVIVAATMAALQRDGGFVSVLV